MKIGIAAEQKGETMRLIDADELMEHVCRDKLDSRELIADMVNNAPTVTDVAETKKMCEELKAHIEYINRQNARMEGEIKALVFAVRCGGVSGNEVRYEIDGDALIRDHFSPEHRIALSEANKAWMRNIINNAPTIDAVEVVKCKDCKYSVDYYNDGECYCQRPGRELQWISRRWDFFCAAGRKKGEDR